MCEKELKPILIITYYWPPSGGAGVQRWLKFSKYLPENGWRPIIFTPENPDFDLKDPSLNKDIHPDVEVLKFPIWEPYKIFKSLSGQKELKQGQILEDSRNSWFKNLAIWLRGNLFIPDPKRFWIKPSVDYLTEIVRTNEIKYVITTGPPHSVHLIGLKLKYRLPSLVWISDFRDPWTQWEILHEMKMTPWVRRQHQKLEQSVLKASDSLLVTSESAKTEFEALGARRVKVITNGFDSEDFGSVKGNMNDKKQFVIRHIGMLSEQRNAESLWKAFTELASKKEDKLKIELIGIVPDFLKRQLGEEFALKNYINFQDSVPHQDLAEIYDSSDLVVLIQTKTNRKQTQLPGKLFEYLQAKRPILAIGDTESDMAKILKQTKAGRCFHYDDQEGILQFLTDVIEGNTHFTFEGIDQFERKILTKDLSDWLASF